MAQMAQMEEHEWESSCYRVNKRLSSGCKML